MKKSAQIDDGGSAFPVPPDFEEATSWASHGMSLREWFAGQALPATYHEMVASEFHTSCHVKGAVKRAYQLADEMMKHRRAENED